MNPPAPLETGQVPTGPQFSEPTRAFGEATASSFLTLNFHQIDGRDICQVAVEPSDHPVYVEQKGRQAEFWLRVGNATRSLPINEAVRHIRKRWSGR